MSGANCKDGCTDCPTCRGEVRPDSHAMKDMGFAMAMAKGPLYEDRFLGPLSIAQSVRDGVRQRATNNPEDFHMLEFVDGITGALVGDASGSVMNDFPFPWTPDIRRGGQLGEVISGPSSFPFPWTPRLWPDIQSVTLDNLTLPEGDPLNADQEVKDALKKIQLSRPDGATRTVQSTKKTTDSTSYACCPKTFLYPAHTWRDNPETLAVPGFTDVPGWSEKPTPYGAKIGVYFDWSAEFWPPPRLDSDGAECNCLCCTFVHIVVRSILTENGMQNMGAGGPDWTEPREDDCFWIVIGGEMEREPHPRDWKGPGEGKVYGVDYFGPYCYGAHDLPKGWPEHERPHYGGKRPPEMTADNVCEYADSDNPSKFVRPGNYFEWSWMSIGLILDRCNLYQVKDSRYYSFMETGRVDWDGNVIYSDNVTGAMIREARKVPEKDKPVPPGPPEYYPPEAPKSGPIAF